MKLEHGFPGRPRIFRDPIHGDISYRRDGFQELIEAIIDTEMFQRLRGIRQNGVMSLVFPGAEHSRFAHSMGAAHVAARMFDAIERNTPAAISKDTARNDTILAALLHDVGHGPFSHTLEDITRALSNGDKEFFHHERMTLRILCEEGSEIYRLLVGYDQELPARLVPFIDKSARTPPRWHYALVSSQLDADRLDYLTRDAHMAGVWTHRFDLERLIDALGVVNGEIVVDSRAKNIIESYLLALDQMYAVAYFHKTNRAAAFLLKSVIWRAVDLAYSDDAWANTLFPARNDKPDPLWHLFQRGSGAESVSPGNQPRPGIPLDEYQCLDEHHVWTLIRAWRDAGDEILAELISDLKKRRFPKLLRILVPKEMASNKKQVEQLLDRITEEVFAIFHARYPDRKAEYYVGLDEPSRLTYSVGSESEGYADAIKLLQGNGEIIPIELDTRSLASLLNDKRYYRGLVVPAWMRDDAERAIIRILS